MIESLHPGTQTLGSVTASLSIRRWVIVGLLLTVHAAFAIATLRVKTPTVDEVAHLPAGISYLQKGTFELYHHNPPLVKLLAAAAALTASPVVDYSQSFEVEPGMPRSHFSFGWEFMYDNAADYQRIFTRARSSVVLISVLAGLGIFLFAFELFGYRSALLALFLWCLSPNTITHAGMVTTDMGVTAFGFWSVYTFWRFMKKPDWLRASAAGLMLGLAQLTKFSALLLGPILIVMLLIDLLSRSWRSRARPPEPRRLLSLFLVVIGVAVVTLNAGYAFEGTGTPLGGFTFASGSLTTERPAGALPPTGIAQNHPLREVLLQRQNRFAGTILARVPVPLPQEYVQGFDDQKYEAEGQAHGGAGYPVYLNGKVQNTGWWWYYLFVLLVKVPLGTWLLTIATLLLMVLRRTPLLELPTEATLLLMPAAVLFAMSFLTDINLGLRYVLPVLPFWFVFLSRCLSSASTPRAITGTLVVACLINLLALRYHPDHLAYFNELVGGPELGDRHLVDSNLDWGQDLHQLSEWLELNHPEETVGLAYFGSVDPSILAASGQAIDFRIAPPLPLESLRPLTQTGPVRERLLDANEQHGDSIDRWVAENPGRSITRAPAISEILRQELALEEGPRPGLFAISANLVHGLPYRLRDHQGNLWQSLGDDQLPTTPGAYSYFRDFVPIAKVGYSIFVYELTLAEVSAFRQRVGLPTVLPGPGKRSPVD